MNTSDRYQDTYSKRPNVSQVLLAGLILCCAVGIASAQVLPPSDAPGLDSQYSLGDSHEEAEARIALSRERLSVASSNGEPTSSQYPPIDESDGYYSDEIFVVNAGTYLDTGCSFRSAGPLVIELWIDRYFGEVDSEGKLVDWQILVSNGFLPEYVNLTMPVFDVDRDSPAPPGKNKEVDNIYVNDVFVGVLDGFNNGWYINDFRVHISDLKFPSKNTNEGAKNIIRVDIDTANPDDEVWCTAIDWVFLELRGWRPIVLLAGWNGDWTKWDSTFVPQLTASKVEAVSVDHEIHATFAVNAAILADTIATVRERYGVDYVDVIGHSKGGLDTRKYLTTNSDVRMLMMIGSPNAGTFAAWIVSRADTFNPWWNRLNRKKTNRFARMLTYSSMQRFNILNPPNLHTGYSLFAGDWDLVRNYHPAFGILSPNDGAVEVSSVFGLPVTYSLLGRIAYQDQVAGPASLAKHNNLHVNISNYSTVIDRMKFRNANIVPFRWPWQGSGQQSRVAAAMMNGRIGGVQTRSQAFQTILSQGISSNGDTLNGLQPLSFDFVVDTGAGIEVNSLTDVSAEIVLTSPSGVLIDSVYSGTEYNVSYNRVLNDGLVEYHYIVDGAESGLWNVQMSPDVAPSSEEGAFVYEARINGSVIELEAPEMITAVKQNDPVNLQIDLSNDNKAVKGATVLADISYPDSTKSQIQLQKRNGNNLIYEAELSNTAMVGEYFVVYSASGEVGKGQNKQEFERFASQLFSVSALSGVISGVSSVVKDDLDGSGLANTLRADVDLDVDVAGRYGVNARLTTGTGVPIDIATVDTVLSAGAHSISFEFEGRRIFSSGVNGPYVLDDMSLFDSDQTLLLSQYGSGYSTSAFDRYEFVHPSIIAGQFSTEAMDPDEDGVYNHILLKYFPTNDEIADGCFVSSTLADSNRVAIDGHTQNYRISPDPNKYAVHVFDGNEIRQHGADGPYVIRSLGFSCYKGSSQYGELLLDSHETASYQATDFGTPADSLWSPIFPDLAINGVVFDVVAASDGSVYVAGDFATIDGVAMGNIARWDGTQWHSLGTGTNTPVESLALAPDGSLYAGGGFATANGITVNSIARWDGSAWSPLGSGVTGRVLAIAFDAQGDLIAGGEFSQAGGQSASNIARWDGTQWTELGGGANGGVYALAVQGSKLYAGGGFTTVGGQSALKVAKWEAGAWSPLGSGILNGPVRALAVTSNGAVFAGGDFNGAGGFLALGIARWSGTAWRNLDVGVDGSVSALYADGNDLYVGGVFYATWEGTALLHSIGRWDDDYPPQTVGYPGKWVPLGSGITVDSLFSEPTVNAIAEGPSGLYVVGSFDEAGSQPADHIALWTAGVPPGGQSRVVLGPEDEFRYRLGLAVPNPAARSTNINYSIAEDGQVTIEIFNLLGQRVALVLDQYQNAGPHQAVADLSSLASGTYIYRMRSGDYVESRRFTVAR